MEAGDAAEDFLAVPVQLLQLVLDQHGVQRLALLDQLLPENNELIDLVGVQCNFLLETLFRRGERKDFREGTFSRGSSVCCFEPGRRKGIPGLPRPCSCTSTLALWIFNKATRLNHLK